MVPTVGQKPICNSHNSTTLLSNKTAPAFLSGDSMPCLSKLSLHCLGEAFIISHDMSLYLQHASCFDMLIYVCIVSSLFHVAHILGLVASKYTHTANKTGAVSPSQKLNLCTMTNVNSSHIFLQYTVNTNEAAQAPYLYTYKILISVSYCRSCSTQQYMELIRVT